MSNLEVPGARLYCEVRGSGPPLLMIAGASGSADAFNAVAERLAAHFLVITYDRRGFSRSQLDGPQDDTHRLQADADDARRLIEYVSNQPAIVFGASSGAIVALELLTGHGSVVRLLVPFEPPTVRLLPDGQKWLDFFSDLYDVYCHVGVEPALRKFREQVLTASDRQALTRAMAQAERAQRVANATYWFEHELRQYPAVDLDLLALKLRADRVVPMVGRESRGFPAHEATVELARRLGRDMIALPGGHLGFLRQPAEFARALREGVPPQREAARA
jgi:pimeloyl-ACP methyl ester carboxylesterase